MKSKIIIGAILIGFLLLLTPSISAVEYTTVIDTNTSRLIREIKSIDINALEQKLKNINNPLFQSKLQKIDFQSLKQKIQSLDRTGPFIDFKLILIVLMDILATILYGRTSLTRLITTILLSIVILQEFLSGENLMANCQNIDVVFFLSIFMVISAFGWRLIPIKSIAIVFVIITYLIGQLVVASIFLSPSTS